MRSIGIFQKMNDIQWFSSNGYKWEWMGNFICACLEQYQQFWFAILEQCFNEIFKTNLISHPILSHSIPFICSLIAHPLSSPELYLQFGSFSTFSKLAYYLGFIYSCYSINHFSECNSSFVETTSTKDLIQEALPKLFQDNIFCAGNDLGKEGSCKGDSGGPLMIKNRRLNQCN